MKRGVVFVVVGAVAVLAAVVLWERRDRPTDAERAPRASGESDASGVEPATDPRESATPAAALDDVASGEDRGTTDTTDAERRRAEADRDPPPSRRTIEGRVVDDRGEALPGAIVRASGASGAAARTDTEGRFALEVDATVEALDVTANRHEAARFEDLADLEGEVRIELAREAMRRIVVEASDGRLLAGARIAIEGAEAASTDALGVVRIEPAPTLEAARLEVEHFAYEPVTQTLAPMLPGEHRTTVVRMESPRRRTRLTVVVRDPERRPVSGASVQIRHGLGAQVTDFHRADSAGRVVLDDPEASWMSRAFGVRVTADGFQPSVRTELRSDVVPEELEIVMYREALEIQVQLVDRVGRARGGCTVRARKADGTGATLVTQTDWQGIARFSRQLESAPYDVVLGTGQPGGFLPEGGNVVVEPIGYLGLVPAPTVSVRSRVVDSATLAGRVVRTAEVAAARASSLRLSCHSGRYVERAFFTIDVAIEADGRFRAEGLPAGYFRVWIPSEAGGGSARQPLAVVPLDIGESRTDVDVQTATSAAIEGR